MIFRGDLALKVMAGEKTVTRRRMSEKRRSPWWSGRCSLIPGKDYAVCPGRGEHAIGRVRVTSVVAAPLGAVTDADARLEGCRDRADFLAIWRAINGSIDLEEIVYRVEFVGL